MEKLEDLAPFRCNTMVDNPAEDMKALVLARVGRADTSADAHHPHMSDQRIFRNHMAHCQCNSCKSIAWFSSVH